MAADATLDMAADIVKMALGKGATDAECTIAEGDEFSVSVRMGDVEQLKEAGSRGAGIRILVGQRVGSAHTSDLTREGLDRMVSSAIDNATVTTDDPHAGLPDAEDLGRIEDDLQIYSDDVVKLDTPFKIDQARRAEDVALKFDSRITNSEGGSYDSWVGARYFANSRGFAAGYRTSSCSISAVPVAKAGDRMERDYWFTVARKPAGLESPEHVGRKAAERVLRRLNARKIPTQKAAVVFEPRIARSLLGHVFEAISGDSIYRKASFLEGKLGERVASDRFTLIDDPTLPGLFGTWPFDDEGVPSRRKVVIEKGVLKTWLLNSYTGRKLGMKTTGNAARGLSSSAVVDHGNFFLEPGTRSPEDIIRSVGRGLYITELMGQGVNAVTGDYSRGAAGLWIENGELAYPVSEVTIAGNLKQMLMDVEAIGSDLDFRGSVAAPTLLIREMTISGS